MLIKISNLKHLIVLKKNTNPRYYRGFFSFKPLLTIVVLAMALFIAPSCEEMDEVGLNLINRPIQINDTLLFPVQAITVLEDSIPTSLAENHLLGIYNDPVFGKTTASIYTEMLPPAVPFFIESNAEANQITVDSVVLMMRYSGHFGDTTRQQRVKVYELGETIPRDTVYSNRSLQIKTNPLYEKTFRPRPTQIVYFYREGDEGMEKADSLPAHLRLNLPSSFGQKIMNDKEDLAEMTTNDDFREYFKGFYITMEEVDTDSDSPGAILYFNLKANPSKLQIFYTVDMDGNEFHRNIEIPLFEQLARKYTHFTNDHTNVAPEIEAQINQTDPSLGDSILFAQSMANFRIRLQFPDIQDIWKEKRGGQIAINSAKMIIPVDTDFLQDNLGIAPSLVLLRQGSEEGAPLESIIDQFFGQSYFGGRLNDSKTEYAFNVTRYIQQLIDDEDMENRPMYLRVSGSIENAERVVLKGPGRTGEKNRMRLEIRYSHPFEN